MFKYILMAFLGITSGAQADGVKRVVPDDYATIADALFAAGNGDVVVIKKGTYHESLDLAGKDDITIRGKGKVIIDGGGATCLTASGAGLNLKNLTFQNGGPGLVGISGTNALVDSCKFRGTSGHGLIFVSGGGHEVVDSKFKDIVGRGLTMITDDSTASRLTLRNTGQEVDTSAIGIFGDSLTVEGCKISGGLTRRGIVVGSEAILPGSENLLADNFIKGIGDDGIRVISGSAVTLVGNVVRKVGSDAFEISDSANDVYVADNRAQGAADAGFEVWSDANQIVDNRSKKCGNGVRLISTADGSFLQGNRVKKSQRGFWLAGDSNTLVENLALGSDFFDLVDEGSNNSFVDNVFETVQ